LIEVKISDPVSRVIFVPRNDGGTNIPSQNLPRQEHMQDWESAKGQEEKQG
jgi:hypothetical protein